MRWTGNVALMGEIKDACKSLVGQPERKTPLRSHSQFKRNTAQVKPNRTFSILFNSEKMPVIISCFHRSI